jgi:hypothetical protein
MSSDAAVIALTFDGTDIQDVDGIFLEIVSGLQGPTEIRGIDVTIPGADGYVADVRRVHATRVKLEGWVRGVGASDEADHRADLADNRVIFRNLFDPTAAEAPLVATLENGAIWTIQARTLPTILWEANVPSHATVSVELQGNGDWEVTAS